MDITAVTLPNELFLGMFTTIQLPPVLFAQPVGHNMHTIYIGLVVNTPSGPN
jgi:hypothetical protein